MACFSDDFLGCFQFDYDGLGFDIGQQLIDYRKKNEPNDPTLTLDEKVFNLKRLLYFKNGELMREASAFNGAVNYINTNTNKNLPSADFSKVLGTIEVLASTLTSAGVITGATVVNGVLTGTSSAIAFTTFVSTALPILGTFLVVASLGDSYTANKQLESFYRQRETAWNNAQRIIKEIESATALLFNLENPEIQEDVTKIVKTQLDKVPTGASASLFTTENVSIGLILLLILTIFLYLRN